jgi:hypothetical protein
MLERFRRRRAGQDVSDPTSPQLVAVTYMTSMGIGRCHLYNPRWCYRHGRLTFVGGRKAGCDIGFDFDQILALTTVAAEAREPERAVARA